MFLFLESNKSKH